MINCIVIEDEPLAIKKLVNYISKLPFLNLSMTFTSGIEAINYLKKNTVDLIFLDIEMKELTGIQLLESVSINSKVIITTAYEKYALKGFELQVCDYLLKPITFNRFVKACDKVNDELQRDVQFKTLGKNIFIKTEYRLEGVDISTILYIKGMGDYRQIVTEEKKIMTLSTFGELLIKLPQDMFFRVHNSFVVALDKIERIERNRIKIGEELIPISDSNSEEFYKIIRK